MRKITKKERTKAGHIYCPYCKPKKVDAVWRVDGSADFRFDVACEEHKDKIIEVKERELTEADYQTWWRHSG
jgi:hypothetical protein